LPDSERVLWLPALPPLRAPCVQSAGMAEVVRNPTEAGAERLGTLRVAIERFPRQAALKRLLAMQGVAISSEVRAQLRDLTQEEGAELAAWFERLN
jgi:hypothetical protein